MDKVASRAHHHHQHQHSHQHPHNHHHLHSHHHSHHSHHSHHHHHSQPQHQSHHYPNYQPRQHHDRAPGNPERPEASQRYDGQRRDSQNYGNQNQGQGLSAVAHLGPQLAAQSKRKEKARIAARARRSQEAQIIMEMANELHISQEKIRRIDKATIVKLAIDYIKAFEILCRFCSTCCQPASAKRAPDTTTITTTIITTTKTTAAAAAQPEQGPAECGDQGAEPARLGSRPAPKLSTGLIFAPRTEDMDSHFLMIRERDGRAAFVLEPDNEVLDDDDLTHLAPQAGDASISLEVEPLEGIVLDTGLFVAASPKCAAAKLGLEAADAFCGGGTNIEAAAV